MHLASLKGLVFIALGFCVVLSAKAQDSNLAASLVAKDKDAIVYIDAAFTQDDDPQAAESHEHGIGFVITDQGYILTAAHVITPPRAGQKLSGITGRMRTSQGYPLTLSLVTPITGQDGDVALLQLPDVQDSFKHVEVERELKGLSVGSELIALAIPPQQTTVIPIAGSIKSINAAEYTDIATNIPFVSGESGCPIFNTYGRVVALCESGASEDPLLTHITPIFMADRLVDIAKKFTELKHESMQDTSAPLAIPTTNDTTSSRTIVQKYCSKYAEKLVVDNISTFHDENSATVQNVMVDPNHPNCVDIVVSLAGNQVSISEGDNSSNLDGASSQSSSPAQETKSSPQSIAQNTGYTGEITDGNNSPPGRPVTGTRASWIGLKVQATRIVTDDGGNEIHMPAKHLSLDLSHANAKN
ncbi:S1 family peptidase [Dyella acidisoli]|uniref:Serine protease n=1 Tax=Dyella acidisoli TaxID=1867834 RepID=A0ABQ5XJC0_9GAMM|nr:serine protease [Dyella acidisoli]GLQ91276.1 hypothetical protein GCM10007901_02260 [Dyella acidisoli]